MNSKPVFECTEIVIKQTDNGFTVESNDDDLKIFDQYESAYKYAKQCQDLYSDLFDHHVAIIESAL